ncbi:hypothetical protein C5B42_04455 [Candidatus Cerribacteria bacterium 'Amazon FNV 2010 28 9']|uniref:Uncharacterized protein n=1 Tax=Candidatus Cerribacteria bacterium 'Amazon FNV 2010 28 9' TaxID=2081795 RepID=A0A317JT18_9BACT|nr:MAG: hypothetical protein C5B42_04455 [Candidatus Cerribacteria bacterium 'Amazon FNV 2010 28 9']
MGKRQNPEKTESDDIDPTPPTPEGVKDAIADAKKELPSGVDSSVLIELYQRGFHEGFELGIKHQPRKSSFWE